MHFCKDGFWNIYLRMLKALLQMLNSTLIAVPGGRCTSLSVHSPTAHYVLDQVQNAASHNNPIGKNFKNPNKHGKSPTRTGISSIAEQVKSAQRPQRLMRNSDFDKPEEWNQVMLLVCPKLPCFLS